MSCKTTRERTTLALKDPNFLCYLCADLLRLSFPLTFIIIHYLDTIFYSVNKIVPLISQFREKPLVEEVIRLGG